MDPAKEPTIKDVMSFLENNLMDALRDHDRRFDGLEARMDGMEGKINGLEKHIERLEQHVEQIEDNVAQIKKDTAKIPALDIILTHTEATVEDHEQRLSKLEGKAA